MTNTLSKINYLNLENYINYINKNYAFIVKNIKLTKISKTKKLVISNQLFNK